jgi:hypothetical protein
MNYYEKLGVLRVYRSRSYYWRKLLKHAIDKGNDSEVIRASLYLHKLETDLKSVLDEKFIFDNLATCKQHVGRRVATAPDSLKRTERYKIEQPSFTPTFE